MAEDCSGEIIESEAAKILSKSELQSLQKIKTEREIAEAGIEGLAHCPYVILFVRTARTRFGTDSFRALMT